jgi:ribosome-binding factor A
MNNKTDVSIKDGRLKEELREAASNFIQRESNGQSLITVSRVELKDKAKQAMIYITVFPQEKEKGALDMLKRKRSEFRRTISEKIKSGILPFCDFEIDKSAELLRKIENL